MSHKIIFTEYAFSFEIDYDEKNNHVTIRTTHNSEFLEWGTKIIASLTEGTSVNMKVVLSPKTIYQIFKDYSQGTLSKMYRVAIPDNFEHEWAPLHLAIHSTMEYQDEWDIKIISLDPMEVPNEKRFESKLVHRDRLFDAKLAQRDKLIDALTAKLEEMSIKMDEMSKLIPTANPIDS